MNILITGGTGFLGNELVRQLYPQANRIVIYSRSESKQAEMAVKFPEYPDNKMRYFIGDVRDEDRLKLAMKGIDIVIHTAALKRIDTCEENVMECYKTNIDGSINVTNAAAEAGVKSCMLVSTDKACDPVGAYGVSKLAAERYFISANAYSNTKFAVCRYPNVIGSTGSIIPIWQKQLTKGETISITDTKMTRMWITLYDAAKFVIKNTLFTDRGCIFIPKMKGKTMLDVAKKCNIGNDAPLKNEVIGLRTNEKLHESLINAVDAKNTYEVDNMFIIYPEHSTWSSNTVRRGSLVPEGFTYTSEVKNGL